MALLPNREGAVFVSKHEAMVICREAGTVQSAEDNMGRYSTYLFARPSFIEGLARVVDAGGTLNVYNASATPELADYLAILHDWCAIGQDITGATTTFAEQNREVSAHVQAEEAAREDQSGIVCST